MTAPRSPGEGGVGFRSQPLALKHRAGWATAFLQFILAASTCVMPLQAQVIISPSHTHAIATAARGRVAWGRTFYVSDATGNDSWSGLLPSPNSTHTDGPFRTLLKAQAAVRSSSTVKITTLRAGTYSVTHTWSFNRSDSGESWISYPGETAVLDGRGTGGIALSRVSHFKFEGLTVQNMGSTGLYLSGSGIAIRWNNFYNCSRNCISGAGVTHSVIDSNVIDGQSPGNPPGIITTGYSAIEFRYGSSGNKVTHNLIQHCEGGAIDFSNGPTDPPNNNNHVDRNILQDVNTNVVDNGAIYMMDRSHSSVGNQITNNVIRRNGGREYSTNKTKAIYLDDLMSNVLVSGNICSDCGQYGWQIHGGDHNTIINNIFDLSSDGTRAGLYQNDMLHKDYGMRGNVIRRNIIYFSGSSPPSSLYRVSVGPSDAPPSVSDQLYYSTAGSTMSNGRTIIDARPFYADPQFGSPSTQDYSMPSSSAAYTLIHFQPLPTDQGPLPFVP